MGRYTVPNQKKGHVTANRVIHKSAGPAVSDSKRLFKLGHAFVKFCLRNSLFQSFPTFDEGQMSDKADKALKKLQAKTTYAFVANSLLVQGVKLTSSIIKGYVEIEKEAPAVVAPAIIDSTSLSSSILQHYSKHNFKQLEEKMGYTFQNRALLLQAFTNASHELATSNGTFERLEFLGDAALEYLIVRHAYDSHLNGGQIQTFRDKVTSNKSYARLSSKLGLKSYLIHNGQEVNKKIDADFFESLAGAVYLDSGMDLDIVWTIFYASMKDELMQELQNSKEGGARPQYAKSVGEAIVPRSSVGIIIGKSGQTIKRLINESGCKIQFKPDEDPTTPDRCATLQGTPGQIARATQMISDLLQRSQNSGVTETFLMHVPANKTGLVIGKGGDTIKQICGESGAHVELSRDPPPNASEKIFVIKGSPYQIHHAQHIIRIKVGDIPPGTPVPHFTGSNSAAATTTLPTANPYGSTGFDGGYNQWQQNGAYTTGQADANQWSNYYQKQQPQATAYGGAVYGAGAAATTLPTANPFGSTGFDGGYNQWQQNGAYTTQQAGANQWSNYYQQQQFQATAYGGAVYGTGATATSVTSAQTQQQTSGAAPVQVYSAQWAEYYRQMGMHEQAALVEEQAKKQQSSSGTSQQATSGYSTGSYN